MTASLQLVCPHCRAVNRVPRGRLGESPRCGACHRPLFTGTPVALDAAMLERHLARSELPLLVDFWAPWCGPCLAMAPQFERAAELLEPALRLGKLDTQAHPDVGARHGVRSIPTLILFTGGAERARTSGAMSADDIVRWVRTQG